MSWFVLGLLCGLFQSFSDVVTKKAGSRFHPYIIGLLTTVSALIVLIPMGVYFGIEIQNWQDLLFATVVSTSINLISSILYIKSLSSADLALSLPITKLSPLFILLTGPLINGDWPTYLGIFGVVLSVVGTYSLNFSLRKVSFWRPLAELWINKGMRRMLIVAILWSVSSPFDKVGVQASSPLAYLITLSVGLAVCQTTLVIASREARSSLSFRAWQYICSRGFISAFVAILHMSALPFAPVAYVLALKRTSVFWGVCWGALIFKEKILAERIAGVGLTFVGMLFILFGG